MVLSPTRRDTNDDLDPVGRIVIDLLDLNLALSLALIESLIDSVMVVV